MHFRFETAVHQLQDNGCQALKGADGPANGNISDGPISSTQAQICSSCKGSGHLEYEYNYRAMTKTCTQCTGEGLLNTKKQREGKDDSCYEQSTTKAGAPRIMTQMQRYFVQPRSSCGNAFGSDSLRLNPPYLVYR